MNKATASLPEQRRRESRREEFAAHVRLVEILAELLDPSVFFSSLENRPRSFLAGLLQKRRGVRAGLPDMMFLMCLKPPVFVELKSRRGVPSRVQRQVFAELRAMGADVYVARTVAAAIEALRRSGVPFRRPWDPPPLQPWEGPFVVTDPKQRLPQEPRVAAQRREDQRRWRQRQRERKAQQQWRERLDAYKAARSFEPGQNPDTPR